MNEGGKKKTDLQTCEKEAIFNHPYFQVRLVE